MSWVISQAMKDFTNSLCSQELGGGFLEGYCLDCEPSAQSNGNRTQQAYCAPDKMTEFSRLSQCGMTFAPFGQTTLNVQECLQRFAQLLIDSSSQADSHAKTLAAKETTTEKATDSTESAAECGMRWVESSVRFDLLELEWKTHRCLWDEVLPWSSVILPRWGMTHNGVVYQHPTATRIMSATGSGCMPTPMATDWKGGTTAIRKDTGKQRLDQFRDWIKCKFGLTYPIPEHSEAVMGWPVGWTDLKPLEMDKFLAWKQQHSVCCVEG